MEISTKLPAQIPNDFIALASNSDRARSNHHLRLLAVSCLDSSSAFPRTLHRLDNDGLGFLASLLNLFLYLPLACSIFLFWSPRQVHWPPLFFGLSVKHFHYWLVQEEA